MDKVMFSSAKCEWETPQVLYDRLNEKYHFDIDVCALPENTKCKNYFSPIDDGLSKDWSAFSSRWMNPPYGKTIGKWVKKLLTKRFGGVLCLIIA